MMSPTIALDELLSHLDAEDTHAARARVPVCELDQLDAAVSSARALSEVGLTVRARLLGDYAGIPDWIRLGAVDAVRGFLDGTTRTCTHSPHPGRPEPVLAAAWRPGLVVCAFCVHLLGARGDTDRTCDRCGRVVAGLDADDAIYPGRVQISALVYLFGTCSDCRPQIPTTDGRPS